jgi:hypothetical protein
LTDDKCVNQKWRGRPSEDEEEEGEEEGEEERADQILSTCGAKACYW